MMGSRVVAIRAKVALKRPGAECAITVKAAGREWIVTESREDVGHVQVRCATVDIVPDGLVAFGDRTGARAPPGPRRMSSGQVPVRPGLRREVGVQRVPQPPLP